MQSDRQNFAPSGQLTYANVVATIAAARAAGVKWEDAQIDGNGRVIVGNRPLLHILEQAGFGWRQASSAERYEAVVRAREKLNDRTRAEQTAAKFLEKAVKETARADAATEARTGMLKSVNRWPRLRFREYEFGDVDAVIGADPDVSLALDQLREAIPLVLVPPQKKKKSKEWYIYDQRELQKTMRRVLVAKGWTHGRVLAKAEEEGRQKVPEAAADLLKDRVHVILDFGNKASYAHNFLTRAALASALADVRLTVLVVATFRFADQIDSNLATYERVLVEVRRVADSGGNGYPLPLLLVGVEPDVA